MALSCDCVRGEIRVRGLIKIEMECELNNIPTEKLALVVTGSISQLGNWNSNKGLIAEEVPKNSGKWVVGLTVPFGIEFEWKCVLVWHETLFPFVWEDGPNRKARIKQNGRFICYWNHVGDWFQPITRNSGFVLPKHRTQTLVNFLEEIVERFNWSHTERPPQFGGILYGVFHFLASAITAASRRYGNLSLISTLYVIYVTFLQESF
ncbi:uncharacterized protein LOC134250289 [Saccostrea cucullata]|uniref:uncharacterized protein LOC134250289 n=1 Tax=Saccostrea cuccullata TaxID=36930 RepID=UPI002ED3E0D4